MTTKYKIIAGFVVMVCLIGAVVFLGFTGLQDSSNYFDEYRRLARLNVGMSDVESSMHSASNDLRSYLASHKAEQLQSARNRVAESLAHIEGMAPFARSDSTISLLEQLTADLKTFDKQIALVGVSVENNGTLFRDKVVAGNAKMADELGKLTQQAENIGNLSALARMAEVWSKFSRVLVAINRFSISLSQEDSEVLVGRLEDTDRALNTLGATLTSAAGRADFNTLQQAVAVMREGITGMQKDGESVRAIIEAINTTVTDTKKKVGVFNADVNTRMVAYGTLSLDNNAAAQRNMMITGSVGLLAGIVIAVFIVMGIVRVLGQMSNFAGAVANGDFAYQVRIREKGEIGAMITAMRAIPEVLERIINKAEALSASIRRGTLRERFDPGEFSGSFSQLSIAVNTVSDAYTTIIDAMPTPMMSANKDGQALFFNSAWQKVSGSDLSGHPCRDALNSEACSNQRCFGKRAMQENHAVSGETEATHNGEKKVLFVNAMPLHDEQGASVGYMEIVSDLTELKQKEAVMLNVAHQASEISDRVAAAAEELAAQVEEISRGAEVQRSRVESTASAMSEMTATVTEVAQSAGRASGQSDDTRRKAEEGANLVNDVVAAITAVNTIGLSLQKNMQELGTQAEGIGGVMNVISDIADQTNLLALNAAIEAARAGEAGRGFAVVADEVRKLAEKTMAATHEVGSSIDAIQHSTKMNIGNVEQAVKNVGQATELASASGSALGEIVGLASANSDVVANIATAAEEQSATSEEINRSVDEISRITTETADGMVQSSEAVQELSRMAQELRRVMEGLR